MAGTLFSAAGKGGCDVACALLDERVAAELDRPGGSDPMEADLRTALRHGRQVCALVRRLFDGTRALHGLDARWRGRLCLAALLHDTGQIAGMRGHHKATCRLVLGRLDDFDMTPDVETSLSGLLACVPEEDRPYVAQLARYHRKVWPGTDQKAFRRLSLADRQAVTIGAALLRIADGLDMSHESLVESVDVEIDGSSVVLVLHAVPGAPEATLEADARRGIGKGELFVEIFGRNLKWRRQ